MSVDIAIAPPLGWLGVFLYRRLGWPEAGDSTNLATQQAFTNLSANLERHASPPKHAAVIALFRDGYVPWWRLKRFVVQWRELEALFAATPVSELVCSVMEGESFEGAVVSRNGAELVVAFSADELKRFVAETEQAAQRDGRAAFRTTTLRDAFVWQFEEMQAFLPIALKAERGLILE